MSIATLINAFGGSYTVFHLRCSVLLEVADVLDLIPGPDHLLRLLFLGSVTAIHVRMQHLGRGLVGLGLGGVGLQQLDGALFVLKTNLERGRGMRLSDFAQGLHEVPRGLCTQAREVAVI